MEIETEILNSADSDPNSFDFGTHFFNPISKISNSNFFDFFRIVIEIIYIVIFENSDFRSDLISEISDLFQNINYKYLYYYIL